MKILSIAGARPNFMKLAAINYAIDAYNNKNSVSKDKIEHLIVHTGQHYDADMSQQFFSVLDIPLPDINLEVGSISHAAQTARIMELFEPVLHEKQPDVLLVVGDVNSTIACTLVASKICYKSSRNIRPLIAHVEAGLRSFDRNMPEEINRILTDTLSDFLFVTEESGIDNLKHEGIAKEKVHFVGNVMIDTLVRHKEKALKLNTLEIICGENNIVPQSGYGVVTLHRPGNVDSIDKLKPLFECIEKISNRILLVFPLHPRTKANLVRFGLYEKLNENKDIIFVKPQSYLDFLNLVCNARLLLTDSGGVQEETTYLKVPCITLRNNTERPVTVDIGTNYLIGCDPDNVLKTAFTILDGKAKLGKIPPLWDGRTGERIITVLSKAIREHTC